VLGCHRRRNLRSRYDWWCTGAWTLSSHCTPNRILMKDSGYPWNSGLIANQESKIFCKTAAHRRTNIPRTTFRFLKRLMTWRKRFFSVRDKWFWRNHFAIRIVAGKTPNSLDSLAMRIPRRPMPRQTKLKKPECFVGILYGKPYFQRYQRSKITKAPVIIRSAMLTQKPASNNPSLF